MNVFAADADDAAGATSGTAGDVGEVSSEPSELSESSEPSEPSSEEADEAVPARRSRLDARAWLRREGGYFAELAALCGFVFARPVLAAFGDSPETFIARDADGWMVALFGLLVVVGPLVGLAGLGAVSSVAGGRVREAAHMVTVVGVAYFGMVQLLRIHTAFELRVVQALAVALALLLALARWKVDTIRTFLRFAGAASLVFLLQFLTMSPSASLVFGGRSASVDPDVAAAVEAAVGEDGPPVVVLMFDALPTASLLDGEGEVDADLYPNLARVAGDGTWYRNHTTVAQDTVHAVPAALSGAMPDERGTPPVASSYPENLFTLLGGAYEIDFQEQVTALCPDSLCPDATGGGWRPLLADGRDLWEQSLERNPSRAGLPGAFESRYQDFEQWVGATDFAVAQQGSAAYFYHVLMPHDPWTRLPGGVRYDASMPADGQFAGVWGPAGADVGFQRQVLQTQVIDEQVGRLVERMEAAGVYEEALVVVTADHGYGFEDGAPVRGLDQPQYDQIMWTPLFVKAPGQVAGAGGGVIEEDNVLSVDVLPIVADALGVDLDELGWDHDGQVPGAARVEPRDPDAKVILDWEWGELRAEDGEVLITVPGVEGYQRVLDSDLVGELRAGFDGDPSQVWARTEYGELLGRQVEGDGLSLGEPVDAELDLQGGPVTYHDVDLASPLPLEVSGISWLGPDEVVALVVGDTVAALVHPQPTPYGVSSVRALLWPDAFEAGDNEVSAYQVSGPVDDPTLHPLPVVSE